MTSFFLFTKLSRILNDISFVYQSYPQDRINIQVIYRFALAQVKCIGRTSNRTIVPTIVTLFDSNIESRYYSSTRDQRWVRAPLL